MTVPDIALSHLIGWLSYTLDIVEGPAAGRPPRSRLIGMWLAAALELDARSRPLEQKARGAPHQPPRDVTRRWAPVV